MEVNHRRYHGRYSHDEPVPTLQGAQSNPSTRELHICGMNELASADRLSRSSDCRALCCTVFTASRRAWVNCSHMSPATACWQPSRPHHIHDDWVFLLSSTVGLPRRISIVHCAHMHTHAHTPLMYIHASTCTHTPITCTPLGNGEGLMQVPPIDGLSLAPPRVHSNNALCNTSPSLFHTSLHLGLASEEHRHKSHLPSAPHQGMYPRHLDSAFLPQLHIILLLPLSLPRHPAFLPLTTNHTPSPSPSPSRSPLPHQP